MSVYVRSVNTLVFISSNSSVGNTLLTIPGLSPSPSIPIMPLFTGSVFLVVCVSGIPPSHKVYEFFVSEPVRSTGYGY